MNERIKQLKEQARDFYLLQEDLECSIKELHELVDTKFAELVARECMSYMEDGDIDFAKFMIKKNFGVEE